MNTKTLKDTAVSLLIGMVGMSYVHAADTDNLETLGDDRLAFDSFVLDCPDLTTDARGKVWDRTEPGPDNTSALMIVTVANFDGSFEIETDVTPNPHGEGGNSSDWTEAVDGGVGQYLVTFEKDADGEENYRGRANCYDRSGGNLDEDLDQDVDQ